MRLTVVGMVECADPLFEDQQVQPLSRTRRLQFASWWRLCVLFLRANTRQRGIGRGGSALSGQSPLLKLAVSALKITQLVLQFAAATFRPDTQSLLYDGLLRGGQVNGLGRFDFELRGELAQSVLTINPGAVIDEWVHPGITVRIHAWPPDPCRTVIRPEAVR